MRVVVGLGSNLGDRLAHLRAAVRRLAESFEVVATSAVYETAPVGPPQPEYLNAAVLLRTSAPLESVLDTLLEIERSHGRVRAPETRWGPRTLDLDVLWAESAVHATERLTVPHPRLTERAFALRPLHDLVPDAIDPRTGRAFPDGSGDAGVRRASYGLG